jgi:hypothetical protein
MCLRQNVNLQECGAPVELLKNRSSMFSGLVDDTGPEAGVNKESNDEIRNR